MKSHALAVANVVAPVALAKDGRYVADAEKSTLQWHGKKLIGGGHTGKIKVKRGEAVVQGGVVTSALVEVDMASLIDEDLSGAEWNAKLVGHLRSGDFFDVETFPTATLKVDRGELDARGEYQLQGTLTVKGKTRTITVAATAKDDGDGQKVAAALRFDRTDFDVKYGSGKFFTGLGDKVIADEIAIDVELALVAATSENQGGKK